MKTPLADLQVQNGARFVDFAGWELPVHYGSQIDEHHAVRERAGCFDVSHMAVLDIKASYADSFLRHVLTGDVNNLSTGQSMYNLLLNAQAGILDDLITYKRDTNDYRMVVNAATCQKDLDWLRLNEQKFSQTSEIKHRTDLCIIAVQGPLARDKVAKVLSDPSLLTIPKFSFSETNDYFVARTGYTGEDGFEVICPVSSAQDLWVLLTQNDVTPAGLGARDSLRLEAGLNLYGHDMTEETSPWESRLSWTIDDSDPTRDFVGKKRLAEIKQNGVRYKLTGLQ